MQASIAPLIGDAITQRIFPGAVVHISLRGETLCHAAFGTTQYADAGSQTVTTETIYDIASLTKLFTATAALRLIDAGEIALAKPVKHYLPTVQSTEVCIQHLLTHTSGLELRLSTLRHLSAAAIHAHICEVAPSHPPGSRLAYTNINSTLLGEVVARVSGSDLATAIGMLVLEPLDMVESGFNPDPALRPRIAPTEWDHEWRKELVHGSVHDESAAALGGVAGHAGLFSTSTDLARFAQFWLNRGVWQGRHLLSEATVQAALSDYTKHLPSQSGGAFHAGLGWMMDRSAFMGHAPAGTVGHTGFTGPVIVVAPSCQASVIVLSNRTYPQRTPPPYRHHAYTAAICDALWHIAEPNSSVSA